MELLTTKSTLVMMLANEFCFAELVRAIISYDSYKNQITFSSLTLLTHFICYNTLS